MSSPIIPFERRKKRNHDAAYLIILLTILVGAFVFIMATVNFLLRSIPVP